MHTYIHTYIHACIVVHAPKTLEHAHREAAGLQSHSRVPLPAPRHRRARGIDAAGALSHLPMRVMDGAVQPPRRDADQLLSKASQGLLPGQSFFPETTSSEFVAVINKKAVGRMGWVQGLGLEGRETSSGQCCAVKWRETQPIAQEDALHILKDKTWAASLLETK